MHCPALRTSGPGCHKCSTIALPKRASPDRDSKLNVKLELAAQGLDYRGLLDCDGIGLDTSLLFACSRAMIAPND